MSTMILSIWLWVQDRCLKWNPAGKWNQRLKPAVSWRFNFDPYPYSSLPELLGLIQTLGEDHFPSCPVRCFLFSTCFWVWVSPLKSTNQKRMRRFFSSHCRWASRHLCKQAAPSSGSNPRSDASTWCRFACGPRAIILDTDCILATKTCSALHGLNQFVQDLVFRLSVLNNSKHGSDGLHLGNDSREIPPFQKGHLAKSFTKARTGVEPKTRRRAP